ncbi:MAG: hypothetical protein WCX64_04165 [Candidatus Micrarchaeia archaeon]
MKSGFGAKEYKLLHEPGNFYGGRHMVVTHVLDSGNGSNYVMGKLVNKPLGLHASGLFRCVDEYTQNLNDLEAWKDRVEFAGKSGGQEAIMRVLHEFNEQANESARHLDEFNALLEKEKMHALELPKDVLVKPGHLLSEKPARARELALHETPQLHCAYEQYLEDAARQRQAKASKLTMVFAKALGAVADSAVSGADRALKRNAD